ncbi:hypothetical protein [Clostridium fessum]|jgi:thiosulfate reductase cytochrome b subunit|uniref:hypothetical protein n=1 Tax=Clostridium fessum TaxID=2126740 RepID=UPI0022E32A9C|nr:hypothetical protein [Clostridium fessum]
MAEKNGFEVLCDNLENDPNKPYGNKVEYIKNKLRRKTLNELIEIKAEAIEDDVWAFSSNEIALSSFFMSGITLAVTLLIRLSDEELGWAGLLLVALWIGFLVYIGVNAKKRGCKNRKFDSVKIWRKYILEIIDDIIQEKKNMTLSNETGDQNIYIVKVEKIEL